MPKRRFWACPEDVQSIHQRSLGFERCSLSVRDTLTSSTGSRRTFQARDYSAALDCLLDKSCHCSQYATTCTQRLLADPGVVPRLLAEHRTTLYLADRNGAVLVASHLGKPRLPRPADRLGGR